MVEHLKALGSGADQVEQFLRDVFANVLAEVHGQPLPILLTDRPACARPPRRSTGRTPRASIRLPWRPRNATRCGFESGRDLHRLHRL